MAILFISDLHLDAQRPAATDAFIDFIANEAMRAQQLFILGDLFEAWIGDDDDDPAMAPVIEALASLRDADVPCYLMHGNRDFLLGPEFARRTGCEIVTDFVTVDVFGKQLLLTHGDLLCTDDKPYMKLRSMVRTPEWKSEFLGKSLSERREIANAMRAQSQTETASKPADIMDVNQTAVEQTMRSHGVHHLVHGHTHRPAIHRFDLDQEVATRFVLGDWYEQGSVLSMEPGSFRLTELPF